MSRSVDELLLQVADRIGRTAADVAPYIDLLRDNWYEDKQSLQGLSVEDIQVLGLPLRIAKELQSMGVLHDGSGSGGLSKRARKRERKAAAAALASGTAPELESSDKGGKAKGKERTGTRSQKGSSAKPEPGGKSGKANGKDRSGSAKAALESAEDKDRDLMKGRGSKAAHENDEDEDRSPMKGRGREERAGAPDDDGPRSMRSRGRGKDDAENRQDHKDGSAARGKGGASGRARDDDFKYVERVWIDTQGKDYEFEWHQRLLGEKGENIRHIREKTGVTLWLRGRGSEQPGTQAPREDLHLFIGADHRVKEEDFEQAVTDCTDLRESVYETFDEWMQGRSTGDAPDSRRSRRRQFRSGSKGKGKGRSKGKRRSGDDVSSRSPPPASKRRRH